MGAALGSPAVPDSSPATRTLSESASKALLASYGVPVVAEALVLDADSAATAAQTLGFPVVAKLCGDKIAHKTERGLVRLGLGDAVAVRDATRALLGAATPDDGDVSVLLAPMIRGNRELIAGMHRDPQFGPTVLVGIGGVVAEALGDVSIRLAPLGPGDADDMLDDLATQALLGAFRGESEVDRGAVGRVLAGLSDLAIERPDVVSVDLNPLIIDPMGQPVAVDALVEVLR